MNRISDLAKTSIKLTVLGASFAFLATSAACGSSSPGPATATAPTEETETIGALPCTLKTQFEGDSQCILPPDPSQGFQFHYGPSNYNDPAEVAKYTLAPGGEVTDCVFFPTPNDSDVYF